MARHRVENEKLVRINRSLHAAWRDAVRTPWRNFRRRLRDALPSSSAGVPVALDEATNLTVVPYEGRLPPPLAQCEVVRALRIPDPNASAQRQFDERRVRPLYRSYRPCAGDDARASRRSILVSGVRPAHFARGPESGATRSSSRFGRDTCRRSRRSSTGRCRTGPASAGCISNGSRARLVSPASICSSPVRTSTITATICKTSFR